MMATLVILTIIFSLTVGNTIAVALLEAQAEISKWNRNLFRLDTIQEESMRY
jgi:hypothetical protein